MKSFQEILDEEIRKIFQKNKEKIFKDIKEEIKKLPDSERQLYKHFDYKIKDNGDEILITHRDYSYISSSIYAYKNLNDVISEKENKYKAIYEEYKKAKKKTEKKKLEKLLKELKQELEKLYNLKEDIKNKIDTYAGSDVEKIENYDMDRLERKLFYIISDILSKYDIPDKYHKFLIKFRSV